MRTLFLSSMLSVALLASCSSGGGEPDDLVALDGSYDCEVNADGPEWDFTFAVSGPASELGSVTYIESDDVANPSGYAMSLEGRLTTERLDFSASVPGTPAGTSGAVGAVPFDCDAIESVQVTFCATHEGTTDSPCWVCGDESMGSPPGGAAGWVDCT